MPGQAAGDVEQPVAQALRLAAGELAVLEEEPLRPGEQVLADQDDLEPGRFCPKVAEGEVLRPLSLPQRMRSSQAARARCSCSRRAILDPCWLVRKTWKRYPFSSLKESWAPGWGRSLRQMARVPSGQEERSRGKLGCPGSLPLAAVGGCRRLPGRLRQGEDRLAHALCQVEPDREAKTAGGDVIDELVRGAGTVCAYEQARPDRLRRQLRECAPEQLDVLERC